jgi:hypothetical protein
MHDALVERADGHEMMSPDAQLGVEHKHDKTLSLGIEERMPLDVKPPVIGSFLRGITLPHVLWRGAFSNRDQLPLLRMSFSAGIFALE